MMKMRDRLHERRDDFGVVLSTGNSLMNIGGNNMAKTKSSTRGVQHKKIVVVRAYRKADGTYVKSHRRSTPN